MRKKRRKVERGEVEGKNEDKRKKRGLRMEGAWRGKDIKARSNLHSRS